MKNRSSLRKCFFASLLSFLMLISLIPSAGMSASAGYVMKASELAEKCVDIAKNYKTLYVMGGFGAPLNDANKARYIEYYTYNAQTDRAAMINAADSETFAFDCVCMIKGILWGWSGRSDRVYGGATYASNGVPDIDTEEMIGVCSDVSTDFSDIEVGELVWKTGHVGIYVGNGLAVECTPVWSNGVQITACNRTVSGYNTRYWTKHGKLPYVSYETPLARGDIDGNGVIDSNDYIMCRRAVLGTYTLSDDRRKRADANGDGSLGSIDYLMIKRHVLGSYTIA